MAKKITRKKYTVSARFDLWVEKTVEAESLNDAMALAQEAGFDDFVEAMEGVEVIDTNRLAGTGVREEWT